MTSCPDPRHDSPTETAPMDDTPQSDPSRPRRSLTRRDSLGVLASAAALFGVGAPVPGRAATTSCASALASDLSAFKAIRVYTGEDGHSHFEEIELKGEALPFRLQHDSQVTPGFVKYYGSKATQITILHGPADLDLPWHNAPSAAHEFFFMVQGSNTLITRTARRVILPGTITIFEDATGSGHAGKVGPEGYTVINVQLG